MITRYRHRRFVSKGLPFDMHPTSNIKSSYPSPTDVTEDIKINTNFIEFVFGRCSKKTFEIKSNKIIDAKVDLILSPSTAVEPKQDLSTAASLFAGKS